MASTSAINTLAVSLGFVPSAMPQEIQALLGMKLDTAAAELADAGIVINESDPRDADLLVLYGEWLYESRKTQAEKPLMLQRLIRNRQTAQIAGGAV